MKPGDLVEIIDYGGYYSTDPPRIGLLLDIVGSSRYPAARVLTEETVELYGLRDLRPVNSGREGYVNNNKER